MSRGSAIFGEKKDMAMRRWKLRQKARLNLLFAQNCAHATLLSLEDGLGWRDPAVLRAATNFEGGVVGCGDTCGIVTGGVLGIGAILAAGGLRGDGPLEKEIQRVSARYLAWFEERIGTCVCRERTGVDFAKLRGLVRYLLPGDKLLKCLRVIGEAVEFLCRLLGEETEGNDEALRPAPCRSGTVVEPHCCVTVLRSVRPAEVDRHPSLAWAASGLAGGVALNGSVCGALLGGILGTGLVFGYDPRTLGKVAITGAFLRGHWYLVRPPRGNLPHEAFARSRRLADGFGERFGSLRCRDIAGRAFDCLEDLRRYLAEANTCESVIAWCQEQGKQLAMEGRIPS